MYRHAVYVMPSHKATESFCFIHTMQYIYEDDKKSALERYRQQRVNVDGIEYRQV